VDEGGRTTIFETKVQNMSSQKSPEAAKKKKRVGFTNSRYSRGVKLEEANYS